jgi:VanZ family protein
MAVIFYFSHQPASAVAIPFGAPDYVGHATGYAVLGLAYVFGLTGGRPAGATWRVAALATVLGLAYGLTDEWHQSFIPGRLPSVSDVVADMVGAGLGAVAATVWAARRAPR